MSALTNEEFENLSGDELTEFENQRQTGAGLLNRVEHYLSRFVSYPSEHALVAHTLWCAHTHLMDCWESTPRLAFMSPERGSGKTRALEVMEGLVPNPVHGVNFSPSYLFRKVSEGDTAPTLLYDEIDNVFGGKGDYADVLGLLNAGHRRGAVAGRCVTVGNRVQTEELPAYCAVALAGLRTLPDTIGSRAIIVDMRRRAPDEQVEPFRHRIHLPQAEHIARDLVVWCHDLANELETAEPDMPESVVDRDADKWEPLLAIADAAAGDWPKRARQAAVALVARSQEQTVTHGVQLLGDLREVFGAEDRLATETILERLQNLPESNWTDVRGKPLDSRGLSTRLKRYGVKPKPVRIGDKTPRGYLAAELMDPWKRYLPPLAAEAQQAQQAQHATISATQNPAENCEKQPHVADVADIQGMGGNVADSAATDAFEERAAALQFDAGLSREDAERQARDELNGGGS